MVTELRGNQITKIHEGGVNFMDELALLIEEAGGYIPFMCSICLCAMVTYFVLRAWRIHYERPPTKEEVEATKKILAEFEVTKKEIEKL